MNMSANDNESVDVRVNVNRRSDTIELEDLEEFNRMERPSRVFSSRHHLSMHPLLPDTNNMEQNEHFRRSGYGALLDNIQNSARNGGSTNSMEQNEPFRRSSHSALIDSIQNSTRNGGSTVNGDTVRNRSPFVRFTITNPETRQITAAGQIPLSSPPPGIPTNTTTTSSDVVDPWEESDDERFFLNVRRSNEPRRYLEQFSSATFASYLSPSRVYRSGRQSRFAEIPYFIRRNIDGSNPNRGRAHRRRVRFSSTYANRGFNEHSHERSQTPEQELPEVLEQEMEPENQYEEVYYSPESISSVSDHSDSGDERRSSHMSVFENPNVDEENRDDLDIPTEIPRTRVVPLIMSPIPFNPQTDISPGTSNETSPPPINSTPFQFDNTDYNRNAILRDVDTRVVGETATMHVEEHPETFEALTDQLSRLFECPVCFEHIIPPIFQCLVGHLICNKCVLMCENCPTCRNAFNSKRNLYMEKVGYLVKFPCKNAVTGCKQQMFIGQKEIHEQECCYQHYQCFFNCAWKGFYPEIPVHMVDNHSTFILNGPEQSIDMILPSQYYGETQKWFLMAHSEYFAVTVYASLPPRRIKAQVNFIGPSNKARRFKFTIILSQNKERGDMSQKLVYERTTLPYAEIHDESNNIASKKDIFSMSQEAYEPYVKLKRRRLPLSIKIDCVSGA